jgi:hypothetical protein
MTSQNRTKLPVFEKKVEGFGNCFYNALYGALKERNLLLEHDIYGNSNNNNNNNNSRIKKFNHNWRKLVAEEIGKHPPPQIKTDYDIIKNAYNASLNNCKKMRREIGYSYQPLNECISQSITSETNIPMWAIDNYIKIMGKENEIQNFIKLYIKSITEKGNEVQEIEIEAAQKILKLRGIILKIIVKNNTSKENYFGTSIDLTKSEKDKIMKDIPPNYILLPDNFSTSRNSNNNNMSNLNNPIKLPYESGSGYKSTPIIYLINDEAEKHFNYFSFNEIIDGGKRTRKFKYARKSKYVRKSKSARKNSYKKKTIKKH